MTIQVTLIGGPADLQRHVADRGARYIRVAHMRAAQARYYGPNDPIHNLSVSAHTYDIRQVDHSTFVGIWQEQWG
jgi:hypothetical protein